ncbi:MAG TPA: PEP-utilizing enzyme, partial [Candidatus Limnocylindrales bacterium]|nr:PEP-utilizing enzyme [Candidatus Limnocylindrales bacterium]
AAADRGADVILVRPETSPDDIAGMDRARGILTATGGFASHAAVVARGWGKPAVVGAGEIVIGAGRVRIGTRELAEGDVISIDGSTGDVYEGVRAGVAVVVPEARTLLGWARDAGIPIGDAEAGATTAVTDAVEGTRDEGDALRTLAVKGYATPDAIAAAIRSPLDIAQGLLDGLIAGGLAEPGAGAFRLTDAGRARAAELLAGDAAAWGGTSAAAALDAFLDLDRRMKAIVTAWQVREVDGAQVANDHADAAYDRGVLDDLAALHADAAGWLAALDGAPRRIAWYGDRLAAAAEQAAAGNGKFVASPRVDSYHGAWFELHEDLIRLAGRTREDEVAAGRA